LRIVQNTTFELRHGRITASVVLIDMNKVFEGFVVIALRETPRLHPRKFPQGSMVANYRSKRRVESGWNLTSRCGARTSVYSSMT
jgi:5-methylcytosine-specific restriction endonuclease McrBC regulatory subunit McrC